MNTNSKKILLLSGRSDGMSKIRDALLDRGYEVFTQRSIRRIEQKFFKINPDLFILDIINNKKKDGVPIAEFLKKKSPWFSKTFIIFLTSLKDEETEIKALETADAHLDKSIDPKVFLDYIDRLFMHFKKNNVSKEESLKLEFGEFNIDSQRFVVERDGKDIVLNYKEFQLLSFLAMAPGQIFTLAEILNQVWGDDVIVEYVGIRFIIHKLRKKLGMNCIETLKGIGYKFNPMRVN